MKTKYTRASEDFLHLLTYLSFEDFLIFLTNDLLLERFTPERRRGDVYGMLRVRRTFQPGVRSRKYFFISPVIRLSLKKYAICYFLCFPRAHSMPYFHHPCTHIFYLILFDFIIESHPQCFKKKREKANRIKYLLNYTTAGARSEQRRVDSQ